MELSSTFSVNLGAYAGYLEAPQRVIDAIEYNY